MKTFQPPAQRNPTRLEDYIFSTFTEDWHYLSSLRLHSGQVTEVPFEVLMDNPMDVADGVTRVQTKFGTLFFNLFENLVIKHNSDGSVKLMFYTEIKNPNKPLNFFRELTAQLGGGYHYAPKFAKFDMVEKVTALAKGQYDNEHDEVLHFWRHGDFGFTLNFQLNPLWRLLFSVQYHTEKQIYHSVRNKGTLLSLLKFEIDVILAGEPLRADPKTEQGKTKFTDYFFHLTQPEFGIFEQTEIRLFGQNRMIGPDSDYMVTYFSNYEINTDAVIRLVDKLVGIYGADDYGYRELLVHEIELIDNSESWTGRNWLINQHHSLQDLNNNAEYTIYQVTLTLQSDDKGLNLYVVGFNKLIEYDALMKGDD